MRYFLDISYDGQPYHGWQKQENAITVQEVIENAISTILKDKINITGSGRTDTGVHAIQQIAHFDFPGNLDRDQLKYGLNSLLDNSISINQINKVTNDAHARFDATGRTYQYFIHRNKNPFLVNRSYYFKPELDLQKIGEACDIICKWRNFKAFSKVKTEVDNFECEIFTAKWEYHENGHVFTVTANRFLRGMVRAMVGTLIEIGQSKLSVREFALILENGNRSEAGTSVPAHGLVLSEVKYPATIYL